MSQGINLSRKDYFDNKMNLMDNKMNLMDNKMNSVNNMYDELTQVNETQSELYSQLAQTNTQVGTINTDVTSLKTTLPQKADQSFVDAQLEQTTQQLEQTAQQVEQKASIAEVQRLETEKASKNEVRLKTVGININDFDESTRQTFLNAQEIDVNVVLGAENVKPINTTFLQRGKNLFDKNATILNKIVNPTNGEIVNNTGFVVSEFIPVKPNITYSATNMSGFVSPYFNIASYDSGYNFISGIQQNSPYTTPTGTAYVRIGITQLALDAFQFEQGSVSTSYEPYQTQMDLSVYGADRSIPYNKFKNPMGYILNNDGIFVVDYAQKTISVNAVCQLVVDQDNFQIPVQTVNISSFLTANPNNIHVIYFDTVSRTINIAPAYNTNLPKTHIVIAYQFQNNISTLNHNALTFINTSGRNISRTGLLKMQNPEVQLVTDGTITLDLKNKQLKATNTTRFVIDQKDYSLPVQTVDISTFLNANPNNIHFVYADISNGTIGIMSANWQGASMPNNRVILFVQYLDGVYGKNANLVNFIDGTGYVKGAFEELKQKLLLPPKMYFVEDMKLPLYKSSIISETKNLDRFKTVLQNVKSNGTPQFKTFEEIELDGNELSSTFRVNIRQNQNYADYYKDIERVKVSANANSGKTKNIMGIADSILGGGNMQTHFLLRTKLNEYGVTSYLRGTINSSEGRPGWSFQNFIGRSNKCWGTTITRSESGATTTQFQNPFLKLATTADKTNHPTWCFRNTGAQTEKSYAEDTDKTGDFYIFDFAWYLSAHSVTSPDVIYLALSTNDAQAYSKTDAINYSRLGLEIIVKQIKAALPNVTIGVIPTSCWNATASEYGVKMWDDVVSDWIEYCINDVTALQATHSNLSIVPIWCHMSRYFNFPYGSASALGLENKAITDEVVHFSTVHGKAEYTNALASWVMNVI